MLWKSVRVFESLGALALVGYLLLSTRTVSGVRFESSGDAAALLATVMVTILFVLFLIYGIAAGDNFGRRARWARKSILNVARCGFFSSDRAMRQYCADIWKVEPVPIEIEPPSTGGATV